MGIKSNICPKGHYYNADIFDECPECALGVDTDIDTDIDTDLSGTGEAPRNDRVSNMRSCPEGHRYNADIYDSCPECGVHGQKVSPVPGMNRTAGGSSLPQMKVCVNGHFYNSIVYDTCPQCGGTEKKTGNSGNPENRNRQRAVVKRTCLQGHLFNADVYKNCPVCGAEAKPFGDFGASGGAKKNNEPEKKKLLLNVCTCPNGHSYNGDIFDICPECGDSVTQKDKGGMKLNLCTCPEGHVYNADIYDYCPECPEREEEKTDRETTVTLVRCPEGHYYDPARADSCPECTQNGKKAAAEETASGRPKQTGETVAPNVVVCLNGHTFSTDFYTVCPECGAGVQSMQTSGADASGKDDTLPQMRLCSKGHFYNGDFYDECPHCAEEAEKTAVSVETEKAADTQKTPDTRKTLNMRVCPNGHYYNADIYSSCPECGADSKEDENIDRFYKRGILSDDALTPPPVVDVEPVVGWLVCVEGPLRGMDFRLREGYNRIGREEGDIVLRGDNSVSHARQAVVAFYAKRSSFYLAPDTGRSIIELNGEPVFNSVEMKDRDIITVGRSRLMLVAACGPCFNWNDGVKRQD